MADSNKVKTRKTRKLIQYLTEAHGKEEGNWRSRWQRSIGLATRPAYKKRLTEHLKETKQHSKLIERRLKRVRRRRVTAKATDLASRGVATAKGPLHALRGTSAEEKELINAKTEYSEEHEEIATYTAIEALATHVGDEETARLARSIRRDGERMATFLGKQIPILTRAMIKAEIAS